MLAIRLHVGYNERMKPEVIAKALSEATDAQLASEKARRDQAKRKTRSGGRNGGRPRKVDIGCTAGPTDCLNCGETHKTPNTANTSALT